ncbi:MAG: AbrB/MazE/SpoVT family DNA-binding domain-containing protein [Actinomycetaceae bacterium]|nr:AbrB/MazE/SpoVT family DNA-binding domain-containing protein [Actinomycetaceae bacterium]
MMTTTMTDTGQVTIPESVRVAAGLAPGMPLDVTASNGGVLIKEAEPQCQLDPNRFEIFRGAAEIKWGPGVLVAMLRGEDD